MRVKLAILAALAVVAGAVGAASLATASPTGFHKGTWGLPASTSTSPAHLSAPKVDSGDQVKRLVVISRNETETDVDNPPAGFSQGDEFASHTPLYMRGKQVGTGEIHGVVTFVNEKTHEANFQFVFTSILRGGQITATGAATFGEQTSGFDAAVTGGTGAYQTVEAGEVHVQFISETVTKVTYQLIMT
jgi:hypothetical protein